MPPRAVHISPPRVHLPPPAVRINESNLCRAPSGRVEVASDELRLHDGALACRAAPGAWQGTIIPAFRTDLKGKLACAKKHEPELAAVVSS